MLTQEQIGRTLELLVQARQCYQLYPAKNPLVTGARVKLASALEQLVVPGANDDRVNIEITRDGFYFGGETIGADRPGIARFAKQLYEAGAKLLWLSPRATESQLDEFIRATMKLESAASSDALAESLSSDAAGLAFFTGATVRHDTGTEDSDLLAYLMRRRDSREREAESADAGAAASSPRDYLKDLLEFFVQVERGDDAKKECLFNTLSDPEKLAKTFSFIAHGPGSGEGPGAQVSMQALRQMLKHIELNLDSMPEDMRSFALDNISEAILTTDFTSRDWMTNQVLSAGIGERGIEDALTEKMPSRVAATVLMQHLRIHEGTTSAVRGFLGQLNNDEQRKAVVQQFFDAIDASGNSDAGEKAAELRDSLMRDGMEVRLSGIQPEARAEAEKRLEKLQQLAEQALWVSRRELLALKEEIAAAQPSVDTRHDAQTFFHLFSLGDLNEPDPRMLQALQLTMRNAVESGDYEFIEHVLAWALGQVRPEVRPETFPTLAPYMRPLFEEPRFMSFLQHLGRAGASAPDKADSAKTTLAALAGDVTPVIFKQLSREQQKARRFALLEIMATLGPSITAFLHEQLANPEWYIVRNTAYLLGRIGNAASVEPLRAALEHAERRVRSEAVDALAAIGTREAAAALLPVLRSPENPVLQGQAAEALSRMPVKDLLPDLLRLLEEQARHLRRHPETAAKILHAIGHLGDEEAIGAVLRFQHGCRSFGVWQRSELERACEEAIAHIAKRHLRDADAVAGST